MMSESALFMSPRASSSGISGGGGNGGKLHSEKRDSKHNSRGEQQHMMKHPEKKVRGSGDEDGDDDDDVSDEDDDEVHTVKDSDDDDDGDTMNGSDDEEEDEDNDDDNEDDDENSGEDDGFMYLRKLKKQRGSVKSKIMLDFHPELKKYSYPEILSLCTIVRNPAKNNQIDDPNHKTIPFLTRYEKARIIGERTKQLNCGAEPFIQLKSGENIVDGYTIAMREFEEKRIPFIVQRPFPNGTSEFWKLQDLEY